MDKILKYSTLGYALLILFGYSYLDTYYREWDIKIYSYLDASEILLVFLRSVTPVIFVVIGSAIAYSVPISTIFQTSSNNLVEVNTSAQKKTRKFDFILNIIMVLGFLIVITILILTNSKQNYFDFELIPVKITLIFVTAILIYHWLPSLIVKRKVHIELILLRVILIILTLYWINHLFAIAHYLQIKNKILKTSVNFNYESINYQTNDTLFYVGATSKYIFLNNPKNQTNYIFEKENITNFKIRTINK